ncbi:hypothetical protein EDF81_3455 [Enterobacter sp. BIGb0383]|uniref:haloacid dehalogenase-like hydrolase n=1 Tax=unclassified Enterobacter TaxID=2608935 RepID=UPI000F476635|nr:MULTISPECIES: haloacid dehalogenase-like hydrolase [unclassified Enterobacter]ROP58290.1 hypothetical protein EDF81_3455 [Enterobacter sp. BIGb0383]ROS06822.1 hypothetical protein EC848_3316 [Enterobacter sp. BIGb0359]
MKNTSVSFDDIEQQFLKSDAKVLSLDCFDTLFWRYVSRPFDIFTRLQPGLCPTARAKAEMLARSKKRLTTGMEEVSIEEIYSELSGHLDTGEQQKVIERELALEIEHGFLFPPALALLRKAKARGLRTIIVSDTYFNAEQLHRLLRSHSDELPTLIDHIYCSSEFGHGKCTQLWPAILGQEQIEPRHIFHAGDNSEADFTRPIALGIHAVHFKQNEAAIVSIQAQRQVAASILFPSSHTTAPVPSFFHACHSIALRNEISGEKLTAWTMLGPVMYAFAHFIKQQRDSLPGVKLGFLMRDGYMPHAAYQALFPQDTDAAALKISRFTAICSAFHDRQSIINYLSEKLQGITRVTPAGFALMARHLMLSQARSQKIEARLKKRNYSPEYLGKALLANDVVQETLARSAAFRGRLIAHLHNALQLRAGDTLMLVDLGYSGTAQNLLAPLLEKALGITVRGCYLIAAWMPGWHKNRTAMMNPDNADFRLIRTLTRFITSFEMLCSSHDFSVVDYSEEGVPLGENTSLSQPFLPKIRQIQQEALTCIRMAAGLGIPTTPALWDAAAIDLARYIYLPQAEETHLLAGLNFDINLGTDLVKKMVDVTEAVDYMRRYGASRLTMDENDESRTNHASELRSCGMEYALSLFASARYALSWSMGNGTQRQQALDVMFVQDSQNARCETLHATSTFDGYYSLYIPLVTPELAILAGKTLRDMEIHSASLVPQKALYKDRESRQSQPLVLNEDYFIDGATRSNNLVLNMQDDSFLYFRPQQCPEPMVLHLVYRPLNEKSPAYLREQQAI